MTSTKKGKGYSVQRSHALVDPAAWILSIDTFLTAMISQLCFNNHAGGDQNFVNHFMMLVPCMCIELS